MNIENILRSILPASDKYVEGPEILVDGGFELWTGDGDLTNWAEDISGDSRIAQTDDAHSGSWSAACRVADGAHAGVYQGSRPVTPGKRIRVSFWYKTPEAGTPRLWVYAGAGFSYSLMMGANGPEWVDGPHRYIVLPAATSWSQYTLEVDAHQGYGVYLFSVSGDGVSGDYYFDDFSVKELTPAGIVSCWVPGGGKRAIDIFGRGHVGALGSGVTELPSMKELGPELLLNNDFESWASAVDCNSWTENLSGASTVNREATGPKSGTYCVRVDSDGSGSEAYIRQSPTLYAGKTYRLSFFNKAGAGVAHRNLVRVTLGATSYYLQPDSTWKKSGDPGFVYFFTAEIPGTAWRHFSIMFSPPAGSTGQIIGLASCHTEVSKSLYVDKASLREVLPGPIETSLGWKFDGTANAVITTNQASPQGAISAGLWYRRRANGVGSGVFSPVVSLSGGSAATPSFLAARFLDSVYYPVGWLAASNWRYWGAESPSDNTLGGRWVFIIFTLAGNDQYDLQTGAACYLDGVSQNDPSPPIQAYAVAQDARTTVAFGKCGSNYFAGDIAIPFIANRVLTAQEGLNIYNATKGFFNPRG